MKKQSRSFIIYEFFNSDISDKMVALGTKEELASLQGMGIRKDAVIVAEVVNAKEKVKPRNHLTANLWKSAEGESFAVYADGSAIQLGGKQNS